MAAICPKPTSLMSLIKIIAFAFIFFDFFFLNNCLKCKNQSS